MKIAICFWGLCRSSQYTADSFKQNILQPLLNAGFEVDVYLHTFQLFRTYTNPRAQEYNLQLNNTNYKLLGATMTMIENQDTVDSQIQFKAYKTKGDPWGNEKIKTNWETFHNHLRALWSLKNVTYLWKLTEKQYYRIIYVRPDVKFLNPIQIDWLNNCGPNDICIPNFHTIDGCNDRFAIGWPKTMELYGNRFDGALEYSKKYPLHSEMYLAWILRKYNCKIIPISIRFLRIRATGEICPGDKELINL